MPVAMNDVRIPCSGRGSPCAARSGIESLRCVFEIGSTQSGGRCLIAMPISCAGIPAVARRTICGGVRTDSRDRARAAVGDVVRDLRAGVARADDEDVAAAERRRVPVLRRVDQLAGEAPRPGQSGTNGAPLYPVATITARAANGPAAVSSCQRAVVLDPFDAPPVRTSRPCARRSGGSTRAGRRARPSGRSAAGCAGRGGRRGAAACAGAAGRSASATRRRARPRLEHERLDAVAAATSAAVARPADPAPMMTRSRSPRRRSYHPGRNRSGRGDVHQVMPLALLFGAEIDAEIERSRDVTEQPARSTQRGPQPPHSAELPRRARHPARR